MYPTNTDKFTLGYMPTYYDIASKLPRHPWICEIGVQHGYSLRLWQTMFPDAGGIVGVDSHPAAVWPEDTYEIRCDQTNPRLRDLLQQYSPEYDLVIDDASHDGNATTSTLTNLWPVVAPGGYYVIEDWQVGYKDVVPNVYIPSMREMAKGLIDWVYVFGFEVHTITYQYGMIILRKIP